MLYQKMKMREYRENKLKGRRTHNECAQVRYVDSEFFWGEKFLKGETGRVDIFFTIFLFYENMEIKILGSSRKVREVRLNIRRRKIS